jgi:hypothetical protein
MSKLDVTAVCTAGRRHHFAVRPQLISPFLYFLSCYATQWVESDMLQELRWKLIFQRRGILLAIPFIFGADVRAFNLLPGEIPFQRPLSGSETLP